MSKGKRRNAKQRDRRSVIGATDGMQKPANQEAENTGHRVVDSQFSIMTSNVFETISILVTPNQAAIEGSVEDTDDDSAYYDERKALNEAELEASKSYDQYVITLSSAALGLSILFIEKLIKGPSPNAKHFLTIAWASFTLTLFGMLISFLFSQSDWRRARDILDYEQCKRHGIPFCAPNWFARREHRRNLFIYITKILNISCLISFAIGIGSLLYFCQANLPQESPVQMAKKQATKKTSTDEQKGSTSHKRPVRPPKTVKNTEKKSG